MRFALASIVAALAAMATAYTQPNYSEPPAGNAILVPGLNQQVPAGKPFVIEWTPSTTGPISLVLLRGPSSNVKPIATIAESIPNTGKYTWTPSTSLEPDVTHYGILLVVEGTGQYQYSTQFGISNPDYQASSSSLSSEMTSTSTIAASTSTIATSTPAASVSTSTATVIPALTSLVTIVDTATTTECPLVTSTVTPVAVHASTSSTPLINTRPPSPPKSSVKPMTMQTSVSVIIAPTPPSTPNTGLESSGPAPGSTTAPSNYPPMPVSTGAASRSAFSMGAVVVGAFAVLAF